MLTNISVDLNKAISLVLSLLYIQFSSCKNYSIVLVVVTIGLMYGPWRWEFIPYVEVYC